MLLEKLIKKLPYKIGYKNQKIKGLAVNSKKKKEALFFLQSKVIIRMVKNLLMKQ